MPDQPPQRHAPQGRPPFAGHAPYPGAAPSSAPRSDPYQHDPHGQQGWSSQPPYQQGQQPYQQAQPPYQHGQQPYQPGYRLSSDQFKPPASRTPLLISVIVIAVVLAVVATGAFVAWRSDHPTAAPTPSASTSVPIPSSSGNSIQFVSDTGSGTLKILDTRWTSQSLMVKIKLSCSRGQVQHGTFNFKAFDVNGTLYNSNTNGVPDPPMSEGTLYQDESVTGWLAFTVTRQDMTLLLISEYGEAITAFAIKG